MKISVSISLFFALTLAAFAQVPVAMAPPLHLQFFDANGVALANGKIFTYAAGTTTLQNTFADAGGISQNPDPILLDGSGSPSNGSVETGIFLANSSYKFVAMNSANVFQWSVDNVTNYFGLLNSANLWTANQIFAGTITDLLSDDQMIFGTGNQSILDFPPPSATTTFHVSLPQTGTISDNIPTDTSTDSIANKTFLNPLFNSSNCPIVNGPATYVCLPNASPSGTFNFQLAKLTGAPSAVTTAAAGDTSGIIGIAVAGTGTTGNATIQVSGAVTCVFDNDPTAGDYVGISTSFAGQCTDVGTSPPVGSQTIGRALATGLVAGQWPILLNAGSSSSGITLVCQNTTPVTVNASTTGFQPIQTCTLPSSFNRVGAVFRITTGMIVTTTSSGSNPGFSFGISGSPNQIGVVSSSSTTASFNVGFEVVCSVTTAGASMVLSCTGSSTTKIASGSPTITPQIVGPLSSTGGSLVGTILLSSVCQFTVASASNSCQGNSIFVEQLN